MTKIPFYSITKTGVQLHVRLTPNAAHNRIDGVQTRDNNQQTLCTRVTAVPEKGKANKALITLLAKTLNIPKSSITITTGPTSRQKTLTLEGDPASIAKIFATLKGT